MKEKESKKVEPAAQHPTTSDLKKKEFTPIQQLMRAFKECRNIDPDNAEWDKKNFSRHIKAGRELLSLFDGDADQAIAYMKLKKKEWESLLDWGIEGIIRSASRDPRLYGGKKIVAEGSTSINPKTFFAFEEKEDGKH